MGTLTALDAVRQADSILAGIRFADDLTLAASRDGGARAVRLLARAAVDPDDQLSAIAAVHALAQIFDGSADDVLVGLLLQERGFLREHAAWAFGARLPRFDAIGPLLLMVRGGGFSGMIAQRTLEQWGTSIPDHVALAIEAALLGIVETDARARLVETLALVPGRIPERLLCRVAVDADEAVASRSAAVAGLGDRPPGEDSIRIVTDLAAGTDEIAEVARLALFDLTKPAHPRAPWSQGSTIAQLFLHADIDGALTQVGAGDNGGIATLLVRLGDALVAAGPRSRAGGQASERSETARPERLDHVERVLTLSRGGPADALACLPAVGSTLSGHTFAPVPFLGEPVPSIDAWPRRVAAQRGIRRILRAAGTVDSIHLRMADVGSLAAATAARDLDIPVVFTVAPDPHAVIEALDGAGTLSRANFGVVDESEHFWFRARLVQRLAADAAHTVLFPRPNLKADMSRLVGIDIDTHPERHSVIAEGIDLAVIAQASRDAVSAAEPHAPSPAPAFAELDALLTTLPEERRGLPIAVSVGRLHRVKGMATLVEAWSADATLRARCNLLIVGGDLEHPSADEREQLSRIDSVVPRAEAAGAGLLLAGHQGNDTVARWLASARQGRKGLAAQNGVYVCASVKEEFGIALLEAMAAGLAVVAPDGGGPATYVEEGVTGFLINTGDRGALARAVLAAFDLAQSPFGPEYADRARAMVASSFTIEAMADTLTGVYRDVARSSESADAVMSVS